MKGGGPVLANAWTMFAGDHHEERGHRHLVERPELVAARRTGPSP